MNDTANQANQATPAAPAALPRVRQLVIAASDVAASCELLCHVLQTRVAFRDEGLDYFGLENFLLPFGDTFLEVVVPITDPPQASAGGRHIQRCGGDCGYMVIVQVPDFAAVEANFRGHGIRTVHDSKRQHFGVDLQIAHLHPKDVPGAILSLDQMAPASEWPWAGDDWRKAVRGDDPGTALLGCTLASTHPQQLAAAWERALGATARQTDDGFWELRLGDTWIRFAPALGYDWDFQAVPHRLVAFDLATRGQDARRGILQRAKERGLPADDSGFTALGVRFELHLG